jgi:hypothetical protein
MGRRGLRVGDNRSAGVQPYAAAAAVSWAAADRAALVGPCYPHVCCYQALLCCPCQHAEDQGVLLCSRQRWHAQLPQGAEPLVQRLQGTVLLVFVESVRLARTP